MENQIIPNKNINLESGLSELKNNATIFVKDSGKSFLMYTAGMGVLNAASTYLSNLESSVQTLISDVGTNLVGIGVINLVYAPVVTAGIKLGGKLGGETGERIAGNLISIGTSAGFFAYALATNDNDPTLASAVQGVVGLGLTNHQINTMRKDKKLEEII